MNSILIRRIKKLAGVRKDSSVVKGVAMSNLPSIDNAYLLIENGIIKQFGADEESPERADEIINAAGKFVLPAWCDSHTHIVFAGNRSNEFVDKIRGLSYEDIAAKGGGILNSAALLQNTSEEELYENALERLNEISGTGTGAVEIKSGYGLSFESELKMLRVIRRLKETSKLTIKSTFLGAHSFPTAFKTKHSEYIKLLTEKMLPEISKENLADFIDVFCETGYFSVSEMEEILEAGTKHGLRSKVHVNQFNNLGGIQAAVNHGALSVDHLEVLSDEDIQSLKNTETIPTALPGCSFFLRIPYSPVRKMIDAGLPVALASDYNPGSCPSGNMNFVVSLACIQMRLLPEEAINAATINSANAMGVEKELGSIEVDKKANLIITKKIDSLAAIPYYFGNNSIERVIL
jgi:imidazolonepropionase